MEYEPRDRDRVVDGLASVVGQLCLWRWHVSELAAYCSSCGHCDFDCVRPKQAKKGRPLRPKGGRPEQARQDIEPSAFLQPAAGSGLSHIPNVPAIRIG